jgi:hypothetical protein
MLATLDQMKMCNKCFTDERKLEMSSTVSICAVCDSDMIVISESFMVNVIKCIPFAVLCIADPSERLRIKAVKQNYRLIQHVSQTEAVQIAAVSASGSVITLCKDPTEIVWRKAILQNPYCIENLDVYNVDLIKYAISIAPKVKGLPTPLMIKYNEENENEDLNGKR